MRTPLTDFIAVKAWEAKRQADATGTNEESMFWEGYLKALRDTCEFLEEEINRS